MASHEHFSPELIAAIKDIVLEVLEYNFEELFEAYQANNPDQELTEADLIHEILEAGGYQAEANDRFEDIVTIGLYAIGGLLGLV